MLQGVIASDARFFRPIAPACSARCTAPALAKLGALLQGSFCPVSLALRNAASGPPAGGAPCHVGGLWVGRLSKAISQRLQAQSKVILHCPSTKSNVRGPAVLDPRGPLGFQTFNWTNTTKAELPLPQEQRERRPSFEPGAHLISLWQITYPWRSVGRVITCWVPCQISHQSAPSPAVRPMRP